MYLFQAQRSARARTHSAFLQYASFSYILIPSDDAKVFARLLSQGGEVTPRKVRHTEVPGKHYLSPLKTTPRKHYFNMKQADATSSAAAQGMRVLETKPSPMS